MIAKATSHKIVKPLRSGQITIPIEFRRALGIDENTLLDVSMSDGALHLHPLETQAKSAGSPWLKELYDYFAPVRQEIIDRGISEEEVNADIDAAFAEVRAERRNRAK
jgi:AbrB family looped-hinge helix DNA binding protein